MQEVDLGAVVVDGVDGTRELREALVRKAESRPREVAGDRDDPGGADGIDVVPRQIVADAGERVGVVLGAGEANDSGVRLSQQFVEQERAEESGCAGEKDGPRLAGSRRGQTVRPNGRVEGRLRP